MDDSDNDVPRHSDQLVRLLLDCALEHAVFLLDCNGRVTWWSKGAERVFALTREQAIGMPLATIFTPVDERSGLPNLEQAIASADAISEDDRWHLRANGSRFWASGALITLRGAEGEVLGFGKILRDRTDVKEQMTLLQSQLDAIQHADAAKAQVIAKVTHELRNLFAGIGAGLRLMRSNDSDKPRQEHVIELMQQQLQVVSSLTDELLEVQRVKAGKVTLAIEPTVVQQVLHNVLDHLRPHLESKSQVLQLLAPSTPLVIAADPLRLFQVFTNLIENAIKYTPPEGRIWVKATFDDRDAIIHVEDRGKGIAPEMLPRIFDMFTQVDPDASGGGLGIGLALVKELVQLHGGSVQAVSLGLGMGSEFTVRLPLQNPEPAHESAGRG
jgi:PAS domain S-box-containing protein